MKHANVTAEFRSLATGLCAAIETMTGERREEAEELLLQTANLVASRHSSTIAKRSAPKPIAPPVADKLATLVAVGLDADRVIDGRLWKAFEPLSVKAAARVVGIRVKRARANFEAPHVRDLYRAKRAEARERRPLVAA